MNKPATTALRVIAVKDDIVTIKMEASNQESTGLIKNEVVLIAPYQSLREGERLKAEVLRVKANEADAQVFEDTAGIAIGDPVYQTGYLLSAELGPGLLGSVYDGLQNPLEDLATQFGFFLPRGADIDALDRKAIWSFSPIVSAGRQLRAGDVVGTVAEGHFIHKIMVPFSATGSWEVLWIQAGHFNVDGVVAKLQNSSGQQRDVTLSQRWPVKKPLSETLLNERRCERLYPDEPLITTLRIIDTFFPIARGGTACIPGPFGAGKTVLQNLISKNSDADIVVIVACGERAGEVVETITEFPQIMDKTGKSLMERTIIICNTSSMPVAAREASMYTGITIGEYYRQMGYNVLLLADSTSRWAQAMRETSGRLEEIPGEEAFPAYLDSSIRAIYERAGVIRTTDHSEGSLTMIGTVSPAGGNFEEPVTQSTLRTVKAFLGLSYERAYKRFYPAIDPHLSWSRYLKQLAPWYDQHLAVGWTGKVEQVIDYLKKSEAILQMMQVTGEEGITLDDYVIYQKGLFVDMVFLQQDAFDKVDVSTPLIRQQTSLMLLLSVLNTTFAFNNKTEALNFFTKLTGLFKNLNYASDNSPEYQRYLVEIDEQLEAQ